MGSSSTTRIVFTVVSVPPVPCRSQLDPDDEPAVDVVAENRVRRIVVVRVERQASKVTCSRPSARLTTPNLPFTPRIVGGTARARLDDQRRPNDARTARCSGPCRRRASRRPVVEGEPFLLWRMSPNDRVLHLYHRWLRVRLARGTSRAEQRRGPAHIRRARSEQSGVDAPSLLLSVGRSERRTRTLSSSYAPITRS